MPTPRVRCWMLRSLSTAPVTALPFGFQTGEHLLQFGFQLIGQVPPHTADDAEAVGFAVAGDFLGDPHDRLANAEALHEQSVKTDDVAGQADPEEMAVEALQFQQDGAEILGARRGLQGGGAFHRLGVGDIMDAAADAADALGHDRDVVVTQDGLGQLFDAAMGHEAAVFAAAHPFALHVEPEVGGFIEGGMKRAEGHDGAAFGRVVELEFAFVIEAVGHKIPRDVLA